MFIRWKRRTWTVKKSSIAALRIQDPQAVQSDQAGRLDTGGLYAYLVENARTPDGNIKQKTICYLGGLVESNIRFVEHRRRFWGKVCRTLGRMRLPVEDLRSLNLSIAKRIPFVTEEELRDSERSASAIYEAKKLYS